MRQITNHNEELTLCQVAETFPRGALARAGPPSRRVQLIHSLQMTQTWSFCSQLMMGKLKILVLCICLGLTFGAWSKDLVWSELNEKISQTFPNSQFISIDELRTALQKKPSPILVDVRSRAEFEVSHLRGAVHLEKADDILRRYQNYKGLVVVYCSVGYRSGDVAEQLFMAGMKHVKNLKGSIFGWANKGYPVYNDKGKTTYVHPYDRYWGQLLSTKYHPPK